MSKKEVIWFPFYPMDYERDCGELSLTQHGVYFNLMRWYYSTGKPIPAQPERIYRRIGALSAEEKTTTDYVLVEFFKSDGMVWRHPRIDEELEEIRARSKKATTAINKRWENRNLNKNNESNDTNVSAENILAPYQSQSQSHTQKPNTKTRAKKRSIPDDFNVSDQVKTWAQEHGHSRLDERLTHFVGYAKANGKLYLDWDQAFQNAIRDNWAKLEGGKATNELGQWWLSESGTEAAGKSVEVFARAGESANDYKGRIRSAMQRHPA